MPAGLLAALPARKAACALVEEGLRHVLEKRNRSEGFSLRLVTFRGNGVRPEVREGSWERIRDLIYESRGA